MDYFFIRNGESVKLTVSTAGTVDIFPRGQPPIFAIKLSPIRISGEVAGAQWVFDPRPWHCPYTSDTG